LVYYGYFFFSSRRRHTRFSRDWSSDVCSSDLTMQGGMAQLVGEIGSVAARTESNLNANTSLLNSLEAKRNNLSAVNKDEEAANRSEERRVGKECRYWWESNH